MDAPLQSQPNSFLSRLRCAAGTDVGKKREENQDSFGILKTEFFHLYVVADGMGGVKGGAIASRLAVATIEESFRGGNPRETNSIRGAVQRANAAIYEKGSKDPGLAGMGTTVVGMLFIDGSSTVFSVGDSRAYRVRGEDARQLTEDHTLVGELVRSGALSEKQAENHPVSHMLTRSLGPQPETEVDCWSLASDLDAGDVFVLCSDGLYNFVAAEEIAAIVRENSIDDSSQILINLANQRGGSDNITVLIIAYGQISRAERNFEREENSQISRLRAGMKHPTQVMRPKSEAVQSEKTEAVEDNETTIDEPSKSSKRVPVILVVTAALVLGLVVGRLYGRFVSGSATPPSSEVALTTLDQIAKLPELNSTSDNARTSVVSSSAQVTSSDPSIVPTTAATPTLTVVAQAATKLAGESATRDLSRLEQTKRTLQEAITKIDAQLIQVDKPPSTMSDTLNQTRKTADDLQNQLAQIEQDIDKASRKLSQWYGRQKRLESQDPLKLAAEVGATSASVQEFKESFERATYEFIKRRDEYELYPSDDRLRDEVVTLKEKRADALKQLQTEVRKVVNAVLSQTDQEIDELKFRRDTLTIQLETVKQDLDFAKGVTDGAPAIRAALRAKLELRGESLRSSLNDVENLIAERTF